MARIEKLVVVGVGLIGGSFALALRRAGVAGRIVGIGRRAQTLAEAQKLGIIDEGSETYDAAKGADLLMLAMPVGQTQRVLKRLAPHVGASTVITDAGSTKSDVVAAARAELGSALARFVPGHPVAGTEHSGPSAAFASLFENRRVVLTPLKETNPKATARVRDAWEACGARVSELSPEVHDRILATVSHLPHLLAFALVDQVVQSGDPEQLFSYAAGGFRDFTRIASSHPEMWRDICLANRAAMLEALRAYDSRVEELRRALEAGDGAAIEAVFERARNARNRWVSGN